MITRILPATVRGFSRFCDKGRSILFDHKNNIIQHFSQLGSPLPPNSWRFLEITTHWQLSYRELGIIFVPSAVLFGHAHTFNTIMILFLNSSLHNHLYLSSLPSFLWALSFHIPLFSLPLSIYSSFLRQKTRSCLVAQDPDWTSWGITWQSRDLLVIVNCRWPCRWAGLRGASL